MDAVGAAADHRAVRDRSAARARERAAPDALSPAYGTLGSLLFAANRANAAETAYLHAQALAPADVRWPYYLGHVYMNRPDRPKAIAAFERTLQLEPGDVAALVWLGKVLSRRRPAGAGRDALHAGAGGAAWRRGRPLRPGAGGAGSARLLARRRTVRAGARRRPARLDRALPAGPRLPRARRHGQGRGAPAPAGQDRGWPARSADGGAARSARRRRRPKKRVACARLAAATITTAVEHFRKGVEMAPDSISLRYNLARALSLTGDLAGATTAFEETIRRAPQDTRRAARARRAARSEAESSRTR